MIGLRQLHIFITLELSYRLTGKFYEKVIFCIYGASFRLVINGVFHRLFI